MKLLHINTMKTWRGGERQVALLMKELQANNVEQILFCRKDSALHKYAINANIANYSFERTWFSTFIQAKSIAQIVKKENISIIHCHESKAHSMALYAKIFFGCTAKVILYRRVVFPIKGFFSRNIKYSGKYVDMVICESRAVEEIILKSTNIKKTTVIPSMVETHMKYENKEMLSHFPSIKNKRIVGYVAALTYEKDHITFLKTAQLLSKNNNDIHFVIAGEGKLKGELMNYTRTLGIEDKVTFLGFVENIQDLIAEIDILLFTSQKEGLGTTILDFFLAKKTVVCVKNGGSEEIVLHDKTGFICEKEDVECLAKHVNLLFENSETANRITASAYEFVKSNFSTQKVTEQIIKVYKDVSTSSV